MLTTHSPTIYLSIYLTTHLFRSIYLYIHLTAHSPPSTTLPAHISIHPSTHTHFPRTPTKERKEKEKKPIHAWPAARCGCTRSNELLIIVSFSILHHSPISIPLLSCSSEFKQFPTSLSSSSSSSSSSTHHREIPHITDTSLPFSYLPTYLFPSLTHPLYHTQSSPRFSDLGFAVTVPFRISFRILLGEGGKT